MKPYFKFWSVTVLFLVALTASAVAQSTVADVAREYRKTKSASSRVLTNESLSLRTASNDSSVNSTAPASSTDGKADAKAGDKPADDSAEGKQKLAEEWKGKIEGQKAEITRLQRELDVSQRENKLRAAAYYGDAGTRLRDSAKYAEEDKKYQAESAEKQKAIAAAQQSMEKMRDDARRAGVPAGQIP